MDKLEIRKKRNDILIAIVELQGKDNQKGISESAIRTYLNLPKTTFTPRLLAMCNDGEIQYCGGGYILDANAFKHISVKR